MKKILLTVAGFLITLLSIAQSPNLMNYQGVARNAVGNVLPSQPIGLRLSILTGSPTGAVVYQETRTVTTNAFGLFNVVVGSPGAITTIGTIAGINWTGSGIGSGTKYLQVEIDAVGGTNYFNVGSTQLVSVPYALNAGSATPAGPAGGDLTGTYPNPTVAKLQGRAVSAAAPANKNLLMWDAGTVSWIPATAALAGIVSGTGTLNTVAKWTPDGATLGNSKIFDDGTFVGIGTTTPGAGLVVSGNGIWNSAIGIQNTGTGMEWRMNVSGTTFGITKIPGSTFTPLQLFSTGGMDFSNSAGASIARLLDNGDVGVGTITPVDKFHVVRGGNSGMVLGGGANTGSEVKFLNSGTSHMSIYNRGNNALTFAQTSSLSQTNTLGAELMTLTAAGNLGINTITPTARLHSVTAAGVNILAENSGTGDAVVGSNTGTSGRGGFFQVTNTANVSDAIRAETNGSGASWGIRAISTGTNGAGLFQQTNATNIANNLQSTQAGLGRAGLFTNSNAANTANMLEVINAGTGFAVRAASTNAAPKALLTVGAVQLTGIGEANNFLLRSDATGNANWADPAVLFPGAFLWTRVGTNLWNTNLGDNVGIGIVTPTARLHTVNTTGVTVLAENSGTGDAVVGSNTGTSGRGGFFQVTNTTNVSDAIRAETNGSGASWGIRSISTGTNGAGLFQQTNAANTANNLQSNQGGLGRAGLFNSTNAASTASAVEISTNGALASRGLVVTHSGLGAGADISITNTASVNNALQINNLGLGRGALIQSTNTANNANIIDAFNAGPGWVMNISSSNGTPRALKTQGALQFTGIGEGTDNVLVSDAAGNASWTNPSFLNNVQFRVKGLGGKTIPNSALTDVNTWDAAPEYNDGGGIYNAAAGTYTVSKSGLYQVNARALWNAATGNGYKGIYLMVNGGFADGSASGYSTVATYDVSTLSTSVKLAAGAVVKLAVLQSTGANQTLTNFPSGYDSVWSLFLVR